MREHPPWQSGVHSSGAGSHNAYVGMAVRLRVEPHGPIGHVESGYAETCTVNWGYSTLQKGDRAKLIEVIGKVEKDAPIIARFGIAICSYAELVHASDGRDLDTPWLRA